MGEVIAGPARSVAVAPTTAITQPTGAATPNVPLLLAQIIVILVAARLTGALVRRFGQPQVVGEMLAGIALGPSLLGAYAPSISAALFPANSLGFLNALSQIGLLVFMFLVGLEVDPKVIRERGRAAIVISHASIVAPFVLGATLAIGLYPTLAGQGVTFTGFALFMGAAMSVTVMVVLLLPLFFAFTGLRTEVSLIAGNGGWLICALVIAVGVVGKVGGSAVAARATAMPWRDAAVLGVLLNTRGLMELVILNVGLDIGVISRELFAMMDLMAITTTLMTTPVIAWLRPEPAEQHARARVAPTPGLTPSTAWKTARRGEPGSRTWRSCCFWSCWWWYSRAR